MKKKSNITKTNPFVDSVPYNPVCLKYSISANCGHSKSYLLQARYSLFTTFPQNSTSTRLNFPQKTEAVF